MLIVSRTARIVAMLVVASCTDHTRAPAVTVIDADAAPPATNRYRTVKIDGADGAIVPREMAAAFHITLRGEKAPHDGPLAAPAAREFFTPTLADVARAEGALAVFIETQGSGCSPEEPCATTVPLSKRYRRYKRQWVGFVDRGKQKLYGNFFCSSVEVDWTLTPLDFVKDGGSCFFNVVFDLESRLFEVFAVHGEA